MAVPALRGAGSGKTGASADETNSGSAWRFDAAGDSRPDILVSRNDAQAGNGGPGEAFACSEGLDCIAAGAALPRSPMRDTDRELWLELIGRSIPSPAAPDRDNDPPCPSRIVGLSVLVAAFVGPPALMATRPAKPGVRD